MRVSLLIMCAVWESTAAAAPRPIAPLSVSRLSSRRPTLRWELAAGMTGARVELCRDRACKKLVERLDITGTTAQPTKELPTGAVFWRIKGRAGKKVTGAWSPTWEMVVPARTVGDTSWGEASDVDGDGFCDALVAAPGGSGLPGRLYVFAGSKRGITHAAPTTTITQPEGDVAADFGWGVSVAGDVNGDGYSDVVVGAAQAAFVYLGGKRGLATTAAATLQGESSGAGFGHGVAAAGDVNGDGYADIVVGEPGIEKAHVFYGSASGLGDAPARTLEGPGRREEFGQAVAGGDITGDGYGDVLVTAPGGQMVYVYFGSDKGLAQEPTKLKGKDGSFGVTLAVVGDVNGDGFSDVMVSPRWVFYGGDGGLSAKRRGKVEVVDGEESAYTQTVVPCGDIDGDGYADVALPAEGVDSGHRFVLVFNGSLTGLSVPQETLFLREEGGEFSYRAGGPGDVNGDGYADLVLGAPDMNDGAGGAFVYYSDGVGLPLTPDATLSIPEGEAWGLGWSAD